MAAKQVNMIYALHDNNLVHISDVPSGLRCDCICPYCKNKLIAKKGKIKEHHFAHYDSEECQYCNETSLHLAAKQMIMEHKKIMLPAVFLDFPGGLKKRSLILGAEERKVDEVFLENRQESIVPDILLVSGQEKIYVEICVTHAIDNEKLSKIENIGISTIEINLSEFDRSFTKGDLEEVLFEKSGNKRWVYNSYANECLKKFFNVAKPMPIVYRGFMGQIDNCPVNKRSCCGKSYANFITDCNGCNFCISFEGDRIFCSGDLRIAELEDFEKTLEDRIKRYPDKVQWDKR